MIDLLTKENRRLLQEIIPNPQYSPKVRTLEEAMALAEHDPHLRTYLALGNSLCIYEKKDKFWNEERTKKLFLGKQGYYWFKEHGPLTTLTTIPLTANNLRAAGIEVDDFVAMLNHTLYQKLQIPQEES